MKNLLGYSMIFLMGVFTACGNAGGDSKATADSTNNAKVDSAKKADTIASRDSHMADLKPDAAFAVAAADGGMLEVTLGKLAVEKGNSKQIKALGAMMVKDHSKANEELKAVAKAKNITLPENMSDKCQKKVADLSGKSGADFDKAYASLMVDDHKEDIDDFNKEAEKGNDSQLTTWAKGKVPVLQHHLEMAENAKKIVDNK